MCNRHVAHMIADYEAARLKEGEEENEDPEPRNSEQTAMDQPGLLATIRSRLAR